MPEEGQARGWEGREVHAGSQSQVEERLGQAPLATGLIADAAFPVAPLSVMSRLLPTTLVTKTNEKRIWETFPSETDVSSW